MVEGDAGGLGNREPADCKKSILFAKDQYGHALGNQAGRQLFPDGVADNPDAACEGGGEDRSDPERDLSIIQTSLNTPKFVEGSTT